MSSATPSSLASVPASSSIIPVWPNDRFTLEELPTNVLDGIDFWAEHTPDEPAIKFPRGPTTKHGFEIISYSALQTLRNHAATWLAQKLNLTCPAAGEPDLRTIAFLVSPTHEVIVPWMALAAMGYTCQFVSPAHQPDVVANLIFKSHARAIVHSEMDPTWLAKVFSLVTSLKGGKQPDMLALEQDELLNARYAQLQRK